MVLHVDLKGPDSHIENEDSAQNFALEVLQRVSRVIRFTSLPGLIVLTEQQQRHLLTSTDLVRGEIYDRQPIFSVKFSPQPFKFSVLQLLGIFLSSSQRIGACG